MARLAWAAALLAAVPTALAAANVTGVYGIIERRMPRHVGQFTIKSVEGDGDAFTVSDTTSPRGGITIECTTTSACARGLYTYVTEVGGVDIFWTGSRLNELQILPQVGKPITGSAIVPYRYHFNTVTFGYTTAFWSFEKWELLLDWLALKGVNIPLAWVGYEAILVDAFREVGLSDAEIFDFLAGPAFLPWNRFGNIQGSWGGTLPAQWVEDQLALQKQIIPRMAELGMTPILPAFTGFVPRALASHYPNASIILGDAWSGFTAPYSNDSFLEPFDPLFTQLQKSFISKQQQAYGNVTHFYTLDQYNEINPANGSTSYLSSISSNTFDSLRAADPDAVWVMQAWLFFASSAFWTNERIEAFLSGAPGSDSMLILDLFAEGQPQWNRTDSFFGKQWVWCELHNLGGAMGMEGNLPLITQAPLEALYTEDNTMVGVGATMEGQEFESEIVYAILLDQAWSSTPLNVTDYVIKRAARRYQVKSLTPGLQKAWEILGSTIYDNQDPATGATIKAILEFSPLISGLVNSSGKQSLGLPTTVPYDTNTTIVPALQLLWQAHEANLALDGVPEFTFDLVMLSRQLLANRFIDLYTHLVSVYDDAASSSDAVNGAGQPLLDLLADLDALLYTNENYLLSTWIADATQWAHGNASYALLLEFSARNQITLWGPTGEISDYAGKQWAGLVGEYYAARWKLFVSTLVSTKASGRAYNQTEVSAASLQLGQAFDLKTWGTEPGETWGTKGNTFDIVNTIIKRWA
ncbi:glycoside hydrolase family 89 protein [Phlebiopsis gigantea 11061_1 CR5-6]|uniref:Glycoside hydrolase family 89 protein n=1 Tax=Phlebiopsis gigantea (strain 11061_1 CR5-6) TaxID=745531 RepID=A0A0C3S6J6_PHLG1|nr:glycoside hydrolase family 89 protein [Phlebiopsis gigantea 11061_1 CR5-6]